MRSKEQEAAIKKSTNERRANWVIGSEVGTVPDDGSSPAATSAASPLHKARSQTQRDVHLEPKPLC